MSIAVVNITKVLDNAPRARMFAQTLQNIAQDWQKKLQVLDRLKTQVEEKLAKAGEDAPVGTMFGFERDRRLLETEFNQMRERSEMDLSLRAQRFQAQVAEEIAPLIAEFAKGKGLQVVLSAVGPQILYSEASIDITDDILRLYEARFK